MIKKLGPDDDEEDVPNKDATDLGPGTLQAAPTPLIAQPPAPGSSVNLSAMGGLVGSPRPGAPPSPMVPPPGPPGAGPLANIGATPPGAMPPSSTAGWTPPGAMPPGAPSAQEKPEEAPAPSGSPKSVKELLDSMEEYRGKQAQRADELFSKIDPGPLGSSEERTAAFSAATQRAEAEYSPKFLSQLSSSQYQEVKARLGQEGIDVKRDRAGHQNAKDDAAADLSKTRMAMLPFQVGAQAQSANARTLQANSSAIMRAALTGSITESTANTAIDIQHKLADFATKGNAGAITSMFQVLSPELQDLLRPAFGNAVSPAMQEGRAAFQRGLAVGQNPTAAAPLPTPPSLPPVSTNNLTPEMLSNAASSARGMPPVAGAPQGAPLGAAAGMPQAAPQNDALRTLGSNIGTFRPGAGGPPQLLNQGGAGPMGAPRGTPPKMVTEGLGGSPNETAAIARIKSTHDGMDEGAARELYHRAMRILAKPNGHSPAAIAKANGIVHGDKAQMGATQ